MRIAAAVGLLGLCSCTSLTMAEPQIHVSPYLAVYQLRGKTGMQSRPTPSDPLEDNAPQSLRTFGLDHYKEDVGVRVEIGDGFGGVRFDYYRLDMGTTKSGVLGDDYGALQAGDDVRMKADMDELRASYLEPLFDLETEYRNQPLKFRFAAGAVLAYRDLNLRASTVDGARSQRTQIEGNVVYPAIRARLTWRDVALDIDYAVSPDLALGGDFEGLQQDFEARLSYRLPLRDITLFGGYRYSELVAEGTQGEFRYDADLRLDGFQFGVVLTL
ncbi:MAG: hypothetical protein KF830_03355 [Planctomycetes bacterium]|nr:hypothetical protein [Planctomycetota bacterium]